MAVSRVHHPRPIRAAEGDRGFTLVEIMVSMAVLIVGVLGTVSLIDGASAATADNKAREAATGLSREMIELSRSISYQQLTVSGITAGLQSRAALADSSPAAGYTIARRGFIFTVAIEACSLDDPKDNLGSHDSGVTFCADSAGPGVPSKDRNTDDYKRVAITLTWTVGSNTEKSRQTTLVTNPVGGLGPTVKTLTGPTSVTGGTSVQYEVTTSSTPATLEWSINGDVKGSLQPSSTSATFDWVLEGSGQPTVLDGTYLLHAQAFDSEGRSGSARVLTVTINRGIPAAVTGFAGGRNGNGSHVDLEWRTNGEGDVIGYRVYRTDASGNNISRACPPAASSDQLITATSCVDEAAPASGPIYYRVYALDTPPGNSTPREGQAGTVLQIVEGNNRPATPTGLTACSGGDVGCNGPNGQPASVGTTVLTWSPSTDPDGDAISFYRIYRDGTSYATRFDRLYSGSSLVWVDAKRGGVAHDYRLSAVDTKFGESTLTAAVNR